MAEKLVPTTPNRNGRILRMAFPDYTRQSSAPFTGRRILPLARARPCGYLFPVSSFSDQLGALPALNQVTVPDRWQQQAVTALREGSDVVVHAPAGAGKTLIFELWSRSGKNR